MYQVAALQSAIQQYEEINSVLPPLQAEVSTLQWLYSVLNKGEGVMAAMNMNIPVRATGGGLEGQDFGGMNTVHAGHMIADPPDEQMPPPRTENKKRTRSETGESSGSRPVITDYVAVNLGVKRGDPDALAAIEAVHDDQQSKSINTGIGMDDIFLDAQ